MFGVEVNATEAVSGEQGVAIRPEIEPFNQIASAEKDNDLAQSGQGVWLMWRRNDKKERCQIAAHIKHTKTYIITNTAGAKIADMPETEMVALMASGDMELAEAGHVFEKALESVIGGIRESR